MADCGSRQSYADGCRCEACKAAQAEYMRNWKARKAGFDVDAPKPGRPPKGSSASVTVLPGSLPSGSGGAAELAVRAELAGLTSAATRLGAVEAALAMARILDNPLALAQQPSAAARLTAILEDLRKGSARRRGRLASVQAMTKGVGEVSNG